MPLPYRGAVSFNLEGSVRRVVALIARAMVARAS